MALLEKWADYFNFDIILSRPILRMNIGYREQLNFTGTLPVYTSTHSLDTAHKQIGVFSLYTHKLKYNLAIQHIYTHIQQGVEPIFDRT